MKKSEMRKWEKWEYEKSEKKIWRKLKRKYGEKWEINMEKSNGTKEIDLVTEMSEGEKLQ